MVTKAVDNNVQIENAQSENVSIDILETNRLVDTHITGPKAKNSSSSFSKSDDYNSRHSSTSIDIHTESTAIHSGSAAIVHSDSTATNDNVDKIINTKEKGSMSSQVVTTDLGNDLDNFHMVVSSNLPCNNNSHSMVTGSKNGIMKPKVYQSETSTFGVEKRKSET